MFGSANAHRPACPCEQCSPPYRHAIDYGILDWRIGELLRAGFDLEDAEALAGRIDIALHDALKLAKACDPLTATRILL